MYKDFDIPTIKSQQLAERLRECLPGGDTRTSAYYEPYPVGLASGKGCRVLDVDGNEYVDLLNNFTSLVHGHADDFIIDRLDDQSRLGTVFPAPTETQAELAEAIRRRFSSIELLRFPNSGTEEYVSHSRRPRVHGAGRNR